MICYLGLPLPYAALGTGRWDGLVVYAVFPFIALYLARGAAIEPFAVAPTARWRSRPGGQVAVLGAIIAVAAGFAPAVLPLVLLVATAWAIGSVLIGAFDEWWRVLVVAVEAVVVALVLTLPWVVGTALAGKASVGIFGLPLAGATSPGWGEVVRFAVGPEARSPLAWLLVVAAALPLLLGRGRRLVWAARLWVGALASWGLAFAAYRGAMGSFAPSETVVLAPAALAVAACIALGISAFENDLTGREFGWRQLVSVAMLVLVVLGLLPVAAAAAAGGGACPRKAWNNRSGSSAVPARPRPACCGSAIPGPCPSAGGPWSRAWPSRSRAKACPTPPRSWRRPVPGRPRSPPAPSGSRSPAARCTSAGFWRRRASATWSCSTGWRRRWSARRHRRSVRPHRQASRRTFSSRTTCRWSQEKSGCRCTRSARTCR